MSKDKKTLPTLDLDLTENQRRFLSLVVRHPGKKRHELAEELGFSAQTAMRVVSPLAEAGIIIEIDEVTGARGKPPRLVHFAKSSLLTAAFVILPERITVSIADLQGRTIVRETERREFKTCEDQLAAARVIFARIVEDVPRNAKVVSAAVTAAGYHLERGRRVVSRVDPVGWADVDLCRWIEALTGVPCTVRNDAQVNAINILEATGEQNFLSVHLDYGIGGGAVEGGRLLQGRYGNAGAIGRLFPDGDLRPTEKSLRKVLGISSWDGWQSISTLTADQDKALESWAENAAQCFESAIASALPLLDFDKLYICSRMPAEILDMLANRISVVPLGATLGPVAVEHPEIVPLTPDIQIWPVENFADMTHVLAARSFLDPEPVDAEHFAASKISQTS